MAGNESKHTVRISRDEGVIGSSWQTFDLPELRSMSTTIQQSHNDLQSSYSTRRS